MTRIEFAKFAYSLYHFHEYDDTKKQEIEIEFETSLQRKYFKNTYFNLKQSFWHVIVSQ